jgi:hypothetical protein
VPVSVGDPGIEGGGQFEGDERPILHRELVEEGGVLRPRPGLTHPDLDVDTGRCEPRRTPTGGGAGVGQGSDHPCHACTDQGVDARGLLAFVGAWIERHHGGGPPGA